MTSEFIKLRCEIGTQQDVARLLGLSLSQLQKIEQGQRKLRPLYLYALRYLIRCKEHDAGPFDPTRAD